MVKKGRVFVGTIDGRPSIGIYGAPDVDPRIANKAASIALGYSALSGGIPRGFGERGWLVVPVNPNESPAALQTDLPRELGAIGVKVAYDATSHSRDEVAERVGPDALWGIPWPTVPEARVASVA